MPQDDLLERNSELARIDRLVERVRGGQGGALAVEAGAGLGKTALLEHAQHVAGGASMHVLRTRGTELAREHPFGVVLQLFEPVVHARHAERQRSLLDGPARHAAPLFDLAEPSGRAGDDELPLLHALYWLASNLADERPLVLVVDDAHWADRSSLRFLLYLAQRIDALPAAMLYALRPEEPGAAADVLRELGAEPAVERVEPAALSDAAVATLVRGRLGDAEEEFCDACAIASGGNPFLLRELLDEVAREEIDTTRAGAQQLHRLAPDSLRRFVLHRLARLPAEATRLARAAAVLQGDASLPRTAHVAEVAGRDAENAADLLVAAGVLVAGDALAFAHPVLASAVYAEVPPLECARLHARAARALADEGAASSVVGAHLLHAPRERAAWTVEQLRAAARTATGRGASAPAGRFLRRALDEPPPADELPGVLVELAEAEAAAGAPEAAERLSAALAVTGDGVGRAQVLQRLGWVLHKLARFDEAAAHFERAMRAIDRRTHGRLHAELNASYTAAAFLVPERAQDAHARAAEVIAAPRADLGSAGRGLLAQLATQKLFAAEPSGEVRQLAERVLADGRLIDEEGADSVTLWHAVGCLSWSDALDQAEHAIDRAVADARSGGLSVTLAQCLYARAWPRFWRGRIDDAAADAAAAVEAWRGGWGYYLPAAMHWLAMSLVERGEVPAADAALELGGDAGRWADTALMIKWHDARGSVAFARGDAPTAYAEHRAAGELAERSMIRNPAISPWRSGAALAAARVGNADEARALVDEEIDLARRFGAPRPLAAALRASARVGSAGEATDALREAVAVLEGSPCRLELAGTLVDLGAATRRSGHRREAREPLREGLDIAQDLAGATRLRERARAELVASGGRPRRDATTGAGALTPSERRVAELAAAGLTNPEIAHELFVSRKTVEWHLSRVYPKLGITSRAEIAAALGRASR